MIASNVCQAVLNILLGCVPTGVTFYFVAAYSALGGNEVAAYQFTPGKGDAQAAVQEMLKGKAAGMDGIIVATNSLAFFAGRDGSSVFTGALYVVLPGYAHRIQNMGQIRVCMWYAPNTMVI